MLNKYQVLVYYGDSFYVDDEFKRAEVCTVQYGQTSMMHSIYFGSWKHAIRNGINFYNFGTKNGVDFYDFGMEGGVYFHDREKCTVFNAEFLVNEPILYAGHLLKIG